MSQLLENIKLLLFDVDGVLTDNQILISSDNTELKSFCIDDGTGAAIARFADLPIAFYLVVIQNQLRFGLKSLGLLVVFKVLLIKKINFLKFVKNLMLN